jgi:hypothetical protein
MKRKTYSVVLQATLILVLVAFLCTIFLANANNSFAASGKNKSQAVTRTTAIEYTEAQIKQLQGSLNITEDQKELWNNLTEVMRENAKDMDALNKERTENTEPMNAVEHLKFHSQITQAHLDQMNKLIPSLEALYVSMSDEQKKTMDTTFRTGKYGKSKKK